MTEDTTGTTAASSPESGWSVSGSSSTSTADASPAPGDERASSSTSPEPTPAEPPAAAAGDVVRLDGYADTEPARYALVVETTDAGVLVIDLPGVPREHQLGTSRI